MSEATAEMQAEAASAVNADPERLTTTAVRPPALDAPEKGPQGYPEPNQAPAGPPADHVTAAAAPAVEPLEITVPPEMAGCLAELQAQLPLAQAYVEAAQAKFAALQLSLEQAMSQVADELGYRRSEIARFEQRGAAIVMLRKSVSAEVEFPRRA